MEETERLRLAHSLSTPVLLMFGLTEEIPEAHDEKEQWEESTVATLVLDWILGVDPIDHLVKGWFVEKQEDRIRVCKDNRDQSSSGCPVR